MEFLSASINYLFQNILAHFSSLSHRRVANDGCFNSFPKVVWYSFRAVFLVLFFSFFVRVSMWHGISCHSLADADDTYLLSQSPDLHSRSLVATQLNANLDLFFSSSCHRWDKKSNPAKTSSILFSLSRTAYLPHPDILFDDYIIHSCNLWEFDYKKLFLQFPSTPVC